MKGPQYLMLVLFIFGLGLYGARPFNVDDAGTVYAGEYEFEIGCDFWSDQAAFGIDFKHGITERMDFGVGFGFDITPAAQERFGEIEMGFKFTLIPDFIATSVNVTPGLTSYSLNGIITKSFGSAEMDINLGYDATGIKEEGGSIAFGFALLYHLEKSTLGLETTGDKDGFQTWLGGFNYELLNGLAIDAAISGSINDGLFNSATAGISYEF